MISIRKARTSDVADIAAAEARFIDCPWTTEQIREEIENERAVFYVAEADGKFVGYLSGVFAADECEVSNIVVEPEFRRRGIGTALFGSLTADATKLGASAMYLLVRTDNEGAIELYNSLGFKRVGKRSGYYGGKDAYIMKRNIKT